MLLAKSYQPHIQTKKIIWSIVLSSIIIFSIMTISSKPNYINLAHGQKSSENPPYLGVNMRGLQTSATETRNSSRSIPINYYEDSLKLISQAGMNHIRYVFNWEAYEKNPSLFINELITFANVADKWGIKVVYDNHQFHTSSWLNPDRGSGFPMSLFKSNPVLYHYAGGGAPKYETSKVWWTDWWNRSVKNTNGTDGWTLLASFLKKIVNTVDKHPSTLGYEILNEPQIHSNDEWDKIGKFNTFITDELRKVTQKTIAYSQQVPASINAATISVTAENQAKMVPDNKTNVVFKISLYGIPTDSYHGARLAILIKASRLAGVPLYVGEWNNVEREKSKGVFKINPAKSDITQSDVDLFVQTFKKLKVWGWNYWLWNFRTNEAPNFNLIKVTLNGMIQPTKYYEQLKNAIFNSYGG